MPTNYTIVGTGNITFGTNAVGYTAIGVITDATDDRGGDILELKNRYGNTWLKVYFDDRNDGEFTAILDSTATVPERGDLIDVCGFTDVIVEGHTKTWSNSKEKQIKIKWSKPDHLTPA